MPPEQRRFYDVAIAEQHPWSVEAGFQFVTDDERLIGPFNAFLRRPEISKRFGDFSKSVVQGSSLSPQLREVVVLAVGSAWGADYEVYAHRILAAGVGISADDAESLASGRCPEGLDDEAELAYELVRALAGTHRVEPALYADALSAFGELGLFDIWAMTAVYLGVSSVLNLFAVPAPGQALAYDDSRQPSRVESVQRIRGDDAVPTNNHRDHGTTA